MPVTPEIAESNRLQRERLAALVETLDDAALRIRLPNGWTVAGALGHLAFWDRQRLCLIRRWADGDFRSGAYDSDVFNDAVQPLLEMIPPKQIAAAAVRAAEEVDALLLKLPDDMIEETLARPDAPHVNRGEHRGHHIDRIEQALATDVLHVAPPARDAVEMNSDADVRRIIEGHNADAVRWYAAGDADSLANLFAADAWQMPPNAPPLVGREVIRAFWKTALNWGSWEFDFQTQDVVVNGSLAVERGKYRLRFTAKPGVPPAMPSLEDQGNYVVLWRREGDGEWRAVWDAPVSEKTLVVTR